MISIMTTLTCIELAVICLLPDYQPPAPKTIFDFPALMVIYDPSLGGINCDNDCSTVALGPLTDDMWFKSGACHPDLLGYTVYFPAIDFTMTCVDTGSLVTIAYNQYYGRHVVYFDVMWDAGNPPTWLYWLLKDWEVIDYDHSHGHS